jgi:hypothetical protein
MPLDVVVGDVDVMVHGCAGWMRVDGEVCAVAADADEGGWGVREGCAHGMLRRLVEMSSCCAGSRC